MKNLKIIVIEDESIVALNLVAKLKDFPVTVLDFVCSYDEVYETLERNSDANLLIVDINLGNGDSGIELVQNLKRDIEVIYLSAYSDEKTVDDATRTLPLGYLVKPVNKKQLSILLQLAANKIDAVLLQESLVDLTNGYRFNRYKEQLYHNEKLLKLSGKKLQLLKILIEKRGEYIGFRELEEQIYENNPPRDSALRTLIYRLRAKFKVNIIETERYLGVRLCTTLVTNQQRYKSGH